MSIQAVVCTLLVCTHPRFIQAALSTSMVHRSRAEHPLVYTSHAKYTPGLYKPCQAHHRFIQAVLRIPQVYIQVHGMSIQVVPCTSCIDQGCAWHGVYRPGVCLPRFVETWLVLSTASIYLGCISIDLKCSQHGLYRFEVHLAPFM